MHKCRLRSQLEQPLFKHSVTSEYLSQSSHLIIISNSFATNKYTSFSLQRRRRRAEPLEDPIETVLFQRISKNYRILCTGNETLFELLKSNVHYFDFTSLFSVPVIFQVYLDL